MRTLYHFPTSPFARRVRLVLAHKQLPVELRDARAVPAFRDEATARFPCGTVPVFVDDDGTTLGDSTDIARYLDARYPHAPVFPRDVGELGAVLAAARYVDTALEIVVDLGTRFHALHEDARWDEVKAARLSRARASLEALGASLPADRDTVVASGWSWADQAIFTMVTWFEGLVARAPTFPPAAQIMALGLATPPALTAWADRHRQRGDVRSLAPESP